MVYVALQSFYLSSGKHPNITTKLQSGWAAFIATACVKSFGELDITFKGKHFVLGIICEVV